MCCSGHLSVSAQQALLIRPPVMSGQGSLVVENHCSRGAEDGEYALDVDDVLVSDDGDQRLVVRSERWRLRPWCKFFIAV